MTDFPNCSKINLWQEREAAAAAGWEDSGCLRGDTCLSGVSVMTDTRCEDDWVTLRVPECPHHVHLSTKTVKGDCIYFRWLYFAPVGSISLWMKTKKRHKIHYFQILIDSEEEGSGKLKTSLKFAAILENQNHCSAPAFWDSVVQREPVWYFKKMQEYFIIKWPSLLED